MWAQANKVVKYSLQKIIPNEYSGIADILVSYISFRRFYRAENWTLSARIWNYGHDLQHTLLYTKWIAHVLESCGPSAVARSPYERPAGSHSYLYKEKNHLSVKQASRSQIFVSKRNRLWRLNQPNLLVTCLIIMCTACPATFYADWYHSSTEIWAALNQQKLFSRLESL